MSQAEKSATKPKRKRAAKRAETTSEFSFLTRRQISTLFQIPQRIVDQWIATGRIGSMRLSVLGRGGQRMFYSAADVKKMTLVKPPRKRKRRSAGTKQE